MGARWFGALPILAVVGTCVASCLAPTQVQLVLTADDATCPRLASPVRESELYVAPTSVEAETTQPSGNGSGCSAGLVGDLYFVPSHASDEVAVRVVVGVDRATSACTKADNYAGCIVARRRFKYIPHRPLRLPIRLTAGCIGVPCDADKTCDPITSQCIPSLTTPTDDGGLEPGAAQAPDGAIIPPDAGQLVDATVPPIDTGTPDDGGLTDALDLDGWDGRTLPDGRPCMGVGLLPFCDDGGL